jgi:hypothetical protein
VINTAAALSNQKVEVKSATFSIGKVSPEGRRGQAFASVEKVDAIHFYSDSPPTGRSPPIKLTTTNRL